MKIKFLGVWHDEFGWGNTKFPLDKLNTLPELFASHEMARLFISDNGLWEGNGGWRIEPIELKVAALDNAFN